MRKSMENPACAQKSGRQARAARPHAALLRSRIAGSKHGLPGPLRACG
jgi:hypothetical protein